jgi:cytochrome o ubiquinol oxidase subunit IV
MNDEKRRRHREDRSVMKRYLWELFAALLLALVPVLLVRLSGAVRVAAGPSENYMAEYRREFRSYIYGVVLAFGLTGVPFALVYWSVMPPFWLFVAIGVFALIQIIVHFRFFLHIDPPRQKVDDLHLILFSTLILALMAGGTIWILANLAVRMH